MAKKKPIRSANKKNKMVVAQKKKGAVAKPNKAAPATPRDFHDQALRDHLLYLLSDGGAHISFEAAMRDWPVELAGAKLPNFPHTPWMLLEHMRIAQWDILEFSRNPKHTSPKWPDGYWPDSEAPSDEKSWKASIAEFTKDLRTLKTLVANQKADLYVRLPWGDGQTLLREALLVADHNAYHLGQLVLLRKSMGI
jgi:hypothetical protein